MLRWEYMRLYLRRTGMPRQWQINLPGNRRVRGDEDVFAYINRLGQEGWELVSHSGEFSAGYGESLWFKRPVEGVAEGTQGGSIDSASRPHPS